MKQADKSNWYRYDAGSGKSQALQLVRVLSGFTVAAAPESSDKLTRFGPFSSQCRAGNVKILRGSWNAAGLPPLAELLERLNDMTSTSAAASFSSPTAPSTRCTITATCCLRYSGAMPPQRRMRIANVRAAVERYQAFIL